jgi:hypothetical protein
MIRGFVEFITGGSDSQNSRSIDRNVNAIGAAIDQQLAI